MRELRIGVHILEPTVSATVDSIVEAERPGIDTAWMTLGGVRPDSIATFAVAAARTERIRLGTCIVPTYPRHPLALAQSAKVVAELAPGRFCLGVGASHKIVIEDMFGIPFTNRLTHLREYLHILKDALQKGGRVEFQGELFRVNADCGDPVSIQIMVSALVRRSYELAGEMAEGAISWVTPLPFIRDVAIPALEAGAMKAGRTRPAMVMHTGVCVHEDAGEVHEAAMRQFNLYPSLPFYSRMFTQAGYPEAVDGTLSDRMMEAIVIHGHEASVLEQLRRIEDAGVDEVICTIVSAGQDRAASVRRARAPGRAK